MHSMGFYHPYPYIQTLHRYEQTKFWQFDMLLDERHDTPFVHFTIFRTRMLYIGSDKRAAEH